MFRMLPEKLCSLEKLLQRQLTAGHCPHVMTVHAGTDSTDVCSADKLHQEPSGHT